MKQKLTDEQISENLDIMKQIAGLVEKFNASDGDGTSDDVCAIFIAMSPTGNPDKGSLLGTFHGSQKSITESLVRSMNNSERLYGILKIAIKTYEKKEINPFDFLSDLLREMREKIDNNKVDPIEEVNDFLNNPKK